jgi:hypothetical protein
LCPGGSSRRIFDAFGRRAQAWAFQSNFSPSGAPGTGAAPGARALIGVTPACDDGEGFQQDLKVEQD